MLDIIWNILTVIGMILLLVLLLLLLLLVLVLFFPVTYHVCGVKNQEETLAWVKMNWLFGMVRLRYFYPNPGNMTIKLLGLTLFDTASKSKTSDKEEILQEETPQEAAPQAIETAADESEILGTEAVETDASAKNIPEMQSNLQEDAVEQEPTDGERKGIRQWFLSKYDKIKYTIQKIYDKIKHIWENIVFYKELLQDEQTIALIQHAYFRLGRILKSIRPRKIKGSILAGTGSPDTTGYIFGIYGAMSPWLGKYFYVTPDFTQAILEGDIYLAGHITVFHLVWHGLLLVLDKRIRLLLKRIKTHKI